MKQQKFYKAFEDRYRGSREMIKKRQEQYLKFIKPLTTIFHEDTALDIGCGRGEWLELLKQNGIKHIGIDTDSDMLKECKKQKLNVIKSDALSYLSKQKDNSLILITAFHVVEHIAFEDLQKLVQEALRVLKDGGLLIFETPNPNNIKVATEYFYLDPTHIRPIPSALLAFTTEYFGFKRVAVMGMQEQKTLLEKEDVSLKDVLEGPSPDYAVIAQKKAPQEITQKFDFIFEKSYGLSLDILLQKFEQTFQRVENLAINAEKKAIEAEKNYTALLNSHSWKITQPLRYLNKKLQWFYTGVYHWITFSPTSRPRRIVNKILLKLKSYLNKNPKLKTKASQILQYFPKLQEYVANMHLSHTVDKDIKHTYSYRLNEDPKRKLSVEEILARIEKEAEKKEENRS